jgi:hypothetical protein
MPLQDESKVWVCSMPWAKSYTINVSWHSDESQARFTDTLGIFLFTGIGDPAEDGAKNAEPSAKDEESFSKSDPLPAHLAHHERPRYENDIDVRTTLHVSVTAY